MDDAVAVDAKRILLRYGAPINVLDDVGEVERIELARMIAKTHLPERERHLRQVLADRGYMEPPPLKPRRSRKIPGAAEGAPSGDAPATPRPATISLTAKPSKSSTSRASFGRPSPRPAKAPKPAAKPVAPAAKPAPTPVAKPASKPAPQAKAPALAKGAKAAAPARPAAKPAAKAKAKPAAKAVPKPKSSPKAKPKTAPKAAAKTAIKAGKAKKSGRTR